MRTPVLTAESEVNHDMADPELVVGFGAADITPPIGILMSNLEPKKRNEGIGDPLMAKALVARLQSALSPVRV